MFCVIDTLEDRRFMSATVHASVSSGDSTLVQANLSVITIDKNRLANHTAAFDKLIAADKKVYDAAVATAKSKVASLQTAYTQAVQNSATTAKTVTSQLAALKSKFASIIAADKAKLTSALTSLLQSIAQKQLSADISAQASATVSLTATLQKAQALVTKTQAALKAAVTSTGSAVASALTKYKADLAARTATLAADTKQLAADTKKLLADQADSN